MEITYDKEYLSDLYYKGKTDDKKHRFQPTGAFPTHPGEVLKEEIEYRKISQRKLADDIGMSYTALNEILNGKRSLTTTTAYLLEAALDIPASLILNMQMRYDMQMAQADKPFMERLASIRKITAVL